MTKKSQNHSTSLIIGGTTIFALLLVFGGIFFTNQQLNEEQKNWQEYSQTAIHNAKLYGEISSSLGYGGFIHNFKNYVLRRDEFDATLSERNLEKARDAIEKLKQSLKDETSQQAFQDLEDVISNYSIALSSARENADQLSPTELDQIVRVNDRPALEALTFLNNNAEVKLSIWNAEQELQIKEANDLLYLGILIAIIIISFGYSMLRLLHRQSQLAETANSSLNQVNELINKNPDAILIVDDAGEIHRANDQAFELFGYSEKELKDLGIEELVPDNIRPNHDAYRAKYQRQGGARSMGNRDNELHARRKDGSLVPVAISLNRISTIDGMMTLVACRDVTDMVESSNILKEAKQKAEVAAKAKADFLATMSHEIRTPMNGVIGMVDLLVETKLDKEQRQMLRTIRQSGYSLLGVINDILDFSKIEAGKMTIDEVPTSISNIIEGVGETLSSLAKEKGIRLHAYTDPGIPDAVMADPTRLRQILFNLLGNAVKFTEKGKVVIYADIKSKKPDHVELLFKVSDTGVGIPEESQKTLFEAFTQAESSTTRRFGGTGLGLTICRRLVDLMGGELSFTSEYGKGTTFFVKVNFAVPQVHHIKSDGQDLKGTNILLALNDHDNWRPFSRYLEYWGANTRTIDRLENIENEIVEAQKRDQKFDAIVLGAVFEQDDVIKTVQHLQSYQQWKDQMYVGLIPDRTDTYYKDFKHIISVPAHPLERRIFLHSVAAACGRASPDIDYTVEEQLLPDVTKLMSEEEAEKQGTLILLVEDNKTNQLVIAKQLARLGYTCVLADDGQLGLEQYQSRSFGIILTDCHMPNMDGYEMTKKIRDAEKNTGRTIPIIAVTASAMATETNKCFEVGMSDFLPKPVELKRLKYMLEEYLPAHDSPSKSQQATLTAPPENMPNVANSLAIDVSVLIELIGDDEDVINEVLKDFLENAEIIAGDVQKALAEEDLQAIGDNCHKLKSASKSVGAHKLADLCETMEHAAKANNLDAIMAVAGEFPIAAKDVFTAVKARF